MSQGKLPRRVMKFGGSSLATPERVQKAAAIVAQAQAERPVAVVVSAWGGVTDDLIAAARRAALHDDGWEQLLEEIQNRHIAGFVPISHQHDSAELRSLVLEQCDELRDLLRGIALVGEYSARILDCIVTHGERLSAHIFASVLRKNDIEAEAADARAIIHTDDTFGGAQVQHDATYAAILKHFDAASTLQVVPGFTGATKLGDTTSLGRGGSDLTAALLGAALDVETIEIWTDVDGVQSADPRLVPGAFSLTHLRYDELMELSHFGAKVVYPPTVHPARAKNIPLLIKNTFNRDFAGTKIGAGETESPHAIRGISSIHDVALLRLEGDGMVGVPGVAGRLFSALARRDVSVMLIGQASSEHSICFAVLPAAVAAARQEVDHEFNLEHGAGLVDDLIVEEDLCVVAVVGDQMRQHPGIAGKVFSVLGNRGINIRAIAQGSSELNISLVVSRSDEAQALGAIHDSFFGATEKTFDVFIMGTGRVGTALYRQIQDVTTSSAPPRTTLRVTGLCSSTQMCLDPALLGADQKQALDRSRWEALDWDRFIEAMNHAIGPAILVDCTASDELAGVYQKSLQQGIPIVSANKKPVAGSQEHFESIQQACQEGATAAYVETTVGAALPVLQTLQSLTASGDEVVSIEGLFSGTAGYLMGQVHQGVPFSQALKKAHELGYTEPDPREDLAGRDVARKLLILARLSGHPMEPDAIEVDPLVPEALLQTDSIESFWQKISAVDETFAKQAKLAAVHDERLAFLARFEKGKATVSLESLPAGHPCASVTGSDGFVAFHTRRYALSPLSIRGTGAGPEITASGVLADILRAAAEWGGTPTGHLPVPSKEISS